MQNKSLSTLKLTLKSHHRDDLPGFQNKMLVLDGYFNDTIKDLLDRLNEYRMPNNKILRIYNKNGLEIPQTIKLQQNMEFYVDNR